MGKYERPPRVERDRSLTKLCLLVNTVISMALASMDSIPSVFSKD